MPNILLTRIDNRLVHGQVGVTWTKTIGANLLLVANDETSQDKIQQQLMSVTAKSSGRRNHQITPSINIQHTTKTNRRNGAVFYGYRTSY